MHKYLGEEDKKKGRQQQRYRDRKTRLMQNDCNPESHSFFSLGDRW
jgi:hypothetical protein